MIQIKFGIGQSPLIRDSLLVRHLVFTQEQGIPDHMDNDGTDTDCFIVVLYNKDLPIGTGRLSLSENQIARIAVVPPYRGKGYSFQILDKLESYALSHGLEYVQLTPHLDLIGYYEKRGYEELPHSRFAVAGHDLTVMKKQCV